MTELTLRYKLKSFKKNKQDLQKELEEYITNPEYSLDLRWDMFVNAPDELSRHDCSICHGLDNLIKNDDNPIDCWYRHCTDERYSTIHLLDIVSNFEHMIKTNDFYSYKSFSCIKKPGFIEAVKEQILKDNIKSFVFDW